VGADHDIEEELGQMEAEVKIVFPVILTTLTIGEDTMKNMHFKCEIAQRS
jgi:hypothetical protein